MSTGQGNMSDAKPYTVTEWADVDDIDPSRVAATVNELGRLRAAATRSGDGAKFHLVARASIIASGDTDDFHHVAPDAPGELVLVSVESFDRVTRERDEETRKRYATEKGLVEMTALALKTERERDEACAALATAHRRAANFETEVLRLRAEVERDEARLREALEPFQRWPVVLAFAQAMIRKLDHHAPKKGGREGWMNDDPDALLCRVSEEVTELRNALGAGGTKKQVLDEAADVANMVMMVADSEGALDVDLAREALKGGGK